MKHQLIYYLKIVSKLSKIIDYKESGFQDNDIISFVEKCKTLCVDKISEPLVNSFLKETNTQIQPKTDTQIQTEEIQTEEIQTEEIQTEEIKNTIDNLNLLMNINDNKDNKISPEIFDSLGLGLAKLMKPSQPDIITPSLSVLPQIKNELNSVKTNINFKIKKRNE